jgi:hypothetical protein
MKNLETLLSLIAGLIYWIFKTYKAHQAHQQDTAPKSEPTIWNEPSANKLPLPIALPTLPPSYIIQPSQAIPSKEQRKITHGRALKQPLPSNKALPTSTLERKLARYNSLQKSIVIHEILQPKHFF